MGPQSSTSFETVVHFLSLANLILGVEVQVLVIWSGTVEKQVLERLQEQLLLKGARSDLLPVHLSALLLVAFVANGSGNTSSDTALKDNKE